MFIKHTYIPKQMELSNIIDEELAGMIDGYSKDCAVVLSSAGLVHGFHSKHRVETPSFIPRVMYNGIEYSAEKIADALRYEDFSVLKKFRPYKHFVASGLHLLVAGEMDDVYKQTIANLIAGNWYDKTGIFVQFKEKKYMFGS
jgi:hypothetical protein